MWLNSLRDDLSPVQLERFALSKEPKLPMDAYIQVIGEANAEALEDLHMQKKKGVVLTEKLDAFFTEKYGAPWIAEGEARGIAISEAKVAGAKVEAKAETVLAILQTKFQRVSRATEKAIRQMTDPIALDSLAVHAAQSNTPGEFAEMLK